MSLFFNCLSKVEVSEDVMESGIEDHIFGPTKVKGHFFEDVWTLGKNRLLEVDSLVEWEWMELTGIK